MPGSARLKADLSLLLAAFIWGTSFVAQKIANDSMPPLQFVGCRFLLSALLLAPLAGWEMRRPGDGLTALDLRLAVAVGFSLFAALSLQQIGMLTTSATHAGFLTALYVAMVPGVAWVVGRQAPRLGVLAACALSLAGAWLLEQDGVASSWQRGDLLVLLSDLFAALQIILVAGFLRRCQRPLLLSFLQYAVTGVAGLGCGLLFEPLRAEGMLRALPAILYAGGLSGAVAFTLQIVAQRHTPAAEAALIMSLESVFAAGAGAILLGEHLGQPGLAGCALILAGVLLVQLVPAGRRNALEPHPVPPQDTGRSSDRG